MCMDDMLYVINFIEGLNLSDDSQAIIDRCLDKLVLFLIKDVYHKNIKLTKNQVPINFDKVFAYFLFCDWIYCTFVFGFVFVFFIV